jgi:hypothetical protein
MKSKIKLHYNKLFVDTPWRIDLYNRNGHFIYSSRYYALPYQAINSCYVYL